MDLIKWSKIKLELAKKEMSKMIVGQEQVIDGLLRGIIADGNIWVEAVPGTAKTLIVRTLARVLGGAFSRIQFTVDLLPTDIVGLTLYTKEKGFFIQKGPVFANFLLADEINRAPPKTQSALLEAMQEKQVTIGKQTLKIEPPFFVMATQNPIEQEGTYPLPEAQIDRFLFKLTIKYPELEEERQILHKNITLYDFEDFNVKPVLSNNEVLKLQKIVKNNIKLNDNIEKYIVRLSDATRNSNKYGIKLGHYISYGCSPRAAIGMFIASKAKALQDGKSVVTPEHVKAIAKDVMRHRILLNYEGQAEGIKTDDIIDEILKKVRIP